MKRMLACILFAVLAVGMFRQGAGYEAQTRQNIASIESQKSLVSQYCAGCHNEDTAYAGFSWTTVDVAHPEQNARAAEEVVRKIRSGMMPPAGAPRPSRASLDALATGIETRLDEAAAAQPYAGAPELHRVNRREYRNTIKDLLDVDVDVSALLPPDSRTGNFDNMSNALTVTPALMQAYIRAADKIARQAVGDPEAPPVMAKYDIPKVVNQMRHIEGTPFGTRGGMAAIHNFPADGEYTFSLEFYYHYTEELMGSNLPENLQGQEIEISIDGERVAMFKIDPLIEESTGILTTPPIHVKAGPRRLSASFVAKFHGVVEDQYRLVEQTLMDVTIALVTGNSPLPHLRTLTVTGPLKVTGISETPSRKKIFSCRPADASQEEACAAQIITRLSTQAFRRPATPEDLENAMEMYKLGRRDGNFETGIRTAVQAIIAMPEFVFRFEGVPKGVAAGQSYRIDDLELASRLSYFLWSAAPDTELLNVAASGKLRDPRIYDQQVRRMLADTRSETLSKNFANQWLRLGALEEVHPEARAYPDFTRNLAQSMTREVELLFDSVMREDRNVLDLLTADYTFVDEFLAKHYGIPNVLGNRFSRVKLTDPNRFGLLGKGAVLTMSSLPKRTSPVQRGKYVLEVLMGAPPPLPPPEVPPLKENVNNERILTVRERVEQHRQSAACAGCHKIMDPIGLTLENFDAVGVWRSTDEGLPIDATSEMYDGTKLNGPVSLRNAIMSRSDTFVRSFTENLLAYALGRVVDHRDMPAVRSVYRAAAKDGNRFSSFIMGIVKSVPFQSSTLVPATEVQAGNPQR